MGTSVEFASLQRKPGGKANLNWIRDLLRPGISLSWRIAAMGSAPPAFTLQSKDETRHIPVFV